MRHFKPDTGKIYRGTVTCWQLHHLPVTQEHLDKLSAQWNTEKILPLVITGTLKDDQSGRMKAGYHTRTTPLTFFDKEQGYFETRNSIYQLEGEDGCDVFPDLGLDVFKIFY